MNKSIQVNPYEIARLSRNQGLSTGAFITSHMADDGPFLEKTSGGACVFWGQEGCTVHKDRPLVCRLYPLGRVVTPDGEELFRTVEPHPDTKGDYGTNGNVDGFLKTQDAAIYVEAADRYHALFNDLLALVDIDDASGGGPMVQDWLDLDELLSHTEVAETNDDLRDRMIAHIEIIRALAEYMRGDQQSNG